MYGDGILYSGPTAYGNQLITNGNFQTDTDWTKGAGVTISNGNANFINAPGVALYQNIGTQSGFVRVEFNITKYTSGTLNVYSGGNQSVGSINVVGNKIGRYTAKVDRNGGNNNIIFGSSNNFTGSITNVSVKEITQGSDFDFTRSTTGTRINEEGYIEDVPYNLLTYTEAISTDFGVTDVTLTDNYSLSPSGTQTSTRAQLTNLGQSRAFNTVTSSVVSGQSYTFSCYYKGTQGQTVYINALPVGGTEVSKSNNIKRWLAEEKMLPLQQVVQVIMFTLLIQEKVAQQLILKCGVHN